MSKSPGIFLYIEIGAARFKQFQKFGMRTFNNEIKAKGVQQSFFRQ